MTPESLVPTSRIKTQLEHTLDNVQAKRNPQRKSDEILPLRRRVLEHGDILFTSTQQTETTTRGENVSSSILISELGRQILAQNHGLIKSIENATVELGEFPDPDGKRHKAGGESFIVAGDSTVFAVPVVHNGENIQLVVKFHDEGRRTRERHTVAEGANEIIPDHVTGKESFLIHRAIITFSSDPRVSAPEPVFATQRMYASLFIDGDPIFGNEAPKFIAETSQKAIEKAYKMGWIEKERLKVGPFYIRRTFSADLGNSVNVIKKGGVYYVIDPVKSKVGLVKNFFNAKIHGY